MQGVKVTNISDNVVVGRTCACEIHGFNFIPTTCILGVYLIARIFDWELNLPVGIEKVKLKSTTIIFICST